MFINDDIAVWTDSKFFSRGRAHTPNESHQRFGVFIGPQSLVRRGRVGGRLQHLRQIRTGLLNDGSFINQTLHLFDLVVQCFGGGGFLQGRLGPIQPGRGLRHGVDDGVGAGDGLFGGFALLQLQSAAPATLQCIQFGLFL